MSDQSFEKALEELEGIVEKLEEGGLPLNKSLSLFEKGVKLAKYLRDELEKAEKKVDILLKDEEGKVKEKSFDLDEAGSEEEETPESGEDENLPF
jgi:exodeoxyribonuclease VII small subunit